ncbi:MAG: glycosyltransferase involved in cell wall biosynthesis [Saprospiraceae bacterium]|jgi:glycosyltransferase involved in cell wall biosynthesis|tara:strand:+ start:646 stop:1644 length:999 start_codon:yes stop_codon:yes gene_type:complete
MLDTISIIMPVKNGLPFLQECLDSIINQTYTNWELLVVNDHSTDGTLHVLEQYAESDSRIKPAQNLGNGIIHALKTGYDLSHGNYITRMDADDIMPTHKLETLRSLLSNETANAVATGHVKYFSAAGIKDGYKSYENWLNKLCIDANHFQNIYKECAIASPAWMMRKDHFETVGGFSSITYPEDYDLCFRMYEHDVKVVCSPKTVHYWRDHESRTSRNDKNYSDNRFLDLKLAYFQKIEVPKYQKIRLLGAGKKGKAVAKFLLEQEIHFSWATNNVKKIGIDIYGKVLLDYDLITIDSKETAIVIAVANKEEQTEITKKLSQVNQSRIYFLC